MAITFSRKILASLLLMFLCSFAVHAMLTPRLEWVLERGDEKDFFDYQRENHLSQEGLDYALQCMARKRCARGMLTLINNGARAYEYDENVFARAVDTDNWFLVSLLLSKKAYVTVDVMERLCLYHTSWRVCSVFMRVPQKTRDNILEEARQRDLTGFLEFVQKRFMPHEYFRNSKQ